MILKIRVRTNCILNYCNNPNIAIKQIAKNRYSTVIPFVFVKLSESLLANNSMSIFLVNIISGQYLNDTQIVFLNNYRNITDA